MYIDRPNSYIECAWDSGPFRKKEREREREVTILLGYFTKTIILIKSLEITRGAITVIFKFLIFIHVDENMCDIDIACLRSLFIKISI